MLKFKKDILLIMRGLKEIHAIRPGLMLLIMFEAFMNAVSPFVNIYMSSLIIDGIGSKMNLRNLVIYAIFTVSINLLIYLISRLMKHVINFLNFEFNDRYEMKLSQIIMSMNYSVVENPNTHKLREKINEMKSMNGGGFESLFRSLSGLIKDFFTIVFSVSITFSLFTITRTETIKSLLHFIMSPYFSVILAIGILCSVLLSMYSNSTATKKMYNIIQGIIPFNRVYGYYINNYISTYHAGKDIRIYNQKPLIENESMALFDDANITLNRISRNQFKYSSITSISTILVSTLVYLFVGLKALAGLFGVGSIVKYVGSINEFINGFTSFMNRLVTLRSNNEAMKVYYDFIELPLEHHSGINTNVKEDIISNGSVIEFRNVSFRYPESDQYALCNVSFKIKIGSRLAIVGQNGSGKTTVIKLLCRLYEPTEGEILINGTNINEYNYKEYISMFSVVFQDFKLFSFSLGQNIAVDLEYDREKAISCLTKVNFGNRLLEMPNGVETSIYKDFDDNGIEVSGGEAQKIAIARAVYKDAPIVILDEPTAALDPIAEYEIYSNFKSIVEDKTTIYISHRLSSCRFCDNIVVFHEGQLVQQGTHEELLTDTNGKYYELWYSQAQYYSEDESFLLNEEQFVRD